ncbi:hypothetical protein ACFU7X_29410 [Streptomyces chartreusis]|uniref:hypothetical protein n=1 Tax=Streptomyces chartreusis TaxID=1969 RepID=UPI0036C4BE5C
MAQHLRFVLDGDDHLSPVLNNAGDASARLNRRLDDDMDGNAAAVRRFTTDANGRLRDLRGRFVSVADAQRTMGDGMPDLTRRLGDLADAGGGAAASLGRSGGGLGGTMIGVAAIAGVSLLPAIGALVPMMLGAGVAAGTLKLGFSGVSEAVALAGEDTEKYHEALAKMGPEQREFTEAVVDLKKEFGGVGKEVQKAMLPGFTKAVKEAGPLVDMLGDSMTELGGSFGDAAEGVGRMLKDSGFQDDLQTNLKLGNQFVRDMTQSLGPFTRSLLDFGAASGPTLTAFSDGLSGLLSKGLPGMFDGLKEGIGGSAEFVDGLFDSINDILPAIGRFAGSTAEAFGPLFGEGFRVGGDIVSGTLDTMGAAMEAAEPVARDLAYGLRTIRDVGRIIAPTFGDIGSALSGAFGGAGERIDNAVGPLQRLNRWVNNNKITIMEAARMFGHSTITMVDAALQASPMIIRAFALAADGILLAIGGTAHAAAAAFSWIPGIGDKIKGAGKKFDDFREGFVGNLDLAADKAESFANETRPKLAEGQLKLDINSWTAQLSEAKSKLKSVPPEKRSALKATIRDLEEKIARAKGKLKEPKDRTVNVKARDLASSVIGGVSGRLAGLRNRSVTITAVYKQVGSAIGGAALGVGGATGGLYTGGGFKHRGYSQGGLVKGPGTETSDDVWAPWLSKNEFVVNARRTREYLPLLKAINTGQLKEGSLGGSGGTAAAGMEAGRGLAAGMQAAVSLVASAARRMATGVELGIRDELEIRSPSKKTKALAADVAKGFLEGLTGSRDKIKSTSADLVKDIKTAFSGRKESGLVRMVNQQTKKLLEQAAKRDAIAKKIAEAKSYAADVTRTARDQAGLSSLGMNADEVTAGGIKGGLASKLAQIKQFSKYIDMLAKRGLNKGLLRQILNMGPEAGYAYASALAGADKSTIASVNKTQAAIDSESKKLGNKGADILYDSGKNAGKGFLKGLEGQQKNIEKLMMSIAKSMQKSIKKALGIKSPSTVMARLGAYSTEGLARGLLDAAPQVDRSMAAIAGRVSGIQPLLGRAAVAGRAGGGMVVYVTVEVPPTVDRGAVGREIQGVLLTLKRNLGGADLGLT